jgi:hypothetical protein
VSANARTPAREQPAFLVVLRMPEERVEKQRPMSSNKRRTSALLAPHPRSAKVLPNSEIYYWFLIFDLKESDLRAENIVNY